MTLRIDKQTVLREVIAPWSPRALGLLRAVSSVLMPGQSPSIVCSLVMLAAVIQSGSYSILMPDSVLTLLQRANSFRSANTSQQKEGPPNGGPSAVDF